MDTSEQEFSFKRLFVPLTTFKAIHIIVILGFIVFGNTLFNNFVQDDKTYIINDPLTHVVDLAVWFGDNSFSHGGQYRSLPAVYFSITYNIFGTTPFFYHLLQVSLHITCVILLYFLFHKFFSPGLSLFLCLVFLVHPINVESVSYIAQTVNPLFFLFGIIPLLLVTKKNIHNKDIIIACTLLLLSMFTKETGILFLLLLLIYSFFYAKKYIMKLSLGVGVIIGLYCLFRFAIAQVGFETRLLTPIASLSLNERVTNIPAIIFYYLKIIFFPVTLAINQQWVITSINFSNFTFPVIVDLLVFLFIGLAGYYIYKQHKQYGNKFVFFLLWFFLGLCFHLQIFPLDGTVADRWFYFPFAGFLGVIGVLYQHYFQKITGFQKASLIIALVVVSLLSMRTIMRNSDWKDAISLYTHDIQYSDNYDIRNNLGNEYLAIKEYDKAIVQFQKSIENRPWEYSLHNLALAYKEMGDIKKAKKYFTMSLHVKDYNMFFPHKHDSITYKGYSSFLLFYDDASLAIPVLREALKDFPDNDSLLFLLALAKYKSHDRQGAINAATKAYQLHPSEENAFIYENILKSNTFSINLDNKRLGFP